MNSLTVKVLLSKGAIFAAVKFYHFLIDLLMKRFLFAVALLGVILPANAIVWHYDNFNKSKKQCTLVSWGGNQPTSGKLSVPASYKHTDGVTYSVVAIEPHALDNLTKVTEITIPATIIRIGDAKSNSYPSRPMNFDNCPALKKFIVNTSNKSFSAINDMLYVDGKYLLAVPQAIPAGGGSFALPSDTKYISESAFRGNTTITTLTLPRRCNISLNGGLNRAKSIRSYIVTGSGSSYSLSVVDGMLIEGGERIVSCPPKYSAATLTVPSSVDRIEEFAFANTTNLKSIDLSAVSKIGKRAFQNSGLINLTIPGTVTSMGVSTFEGSESLQTIHFECINLTIPERFAKNCRTLARVTSENPIDLIDEAAFKNCSALGQFPFSASTAIYGDSVFTSCGFTKVIYNDDPTNGSTTACEHMFSVCRSLEIIDASAVRGTEEDSFDMFPYFASNCPKLTTLKLPAFTSFWKTNGKPTEPAFGYACVLNHIEMGTLYTLENRPQFCYSPSGATLNFKPKVYIAVTANSKYSEEYNSWAIGSMFQAANGAKVSPQVYVDSYSPSEDYICPTASYFVPGGTLYKYSGAASAGCTVRHNFTIQFEETDDSDLKVTIGQVYPPTADVRDFKVAFNDLEPRNIGTEGSVLSGSAGLVLGYVQKVTVSYTVDGIPMSTIYPKEHWLYGGVDDITVDATGDITVSGRHITGGDGCASITVYNMTGAAVCRVEGNEAYLPDLTPGVYVAEATTTSGKKSTCKFMLR